MPLAKFAKGAKANKSAAELRVPRVLCVRHSYLGRSNEMVFENREHCATENPIGAKRNATLRHELGLGVDTRSAEGQDTRPVRLC